MEVCKVKKGYKWSWGFRSRGKFGKDFLTFFKSFKCSLADLFALPSPNPREQSFFFKGVKFWQNVKKEKKKFNLLLQ